MPYLYPHDYKGYNIFYFFENLLSVKKINAVATNTRQHTHLPGKSQ